MGGALSKRHGNRSEGRISLRAEILVTHDPRVREHKVNAIRNFLLALSARLGDSATSDTRVGAQPTDRWAGGPRGPTRSRRRARGLGGQGSSVSSAGAAEATLGTK
jgi:hypothetical protein